MPLVSLIFYACNTERNRPMMNDRILTRVAASRVNDL